ncbi:hypothetical protein [uncultured Tateyamaria sp.]|uniref:hypothetical protein n=2 Tax=uncultured Tateyamaria sp. TaxID=455651 RepID=UPI0026263581|nr:hypothetical protein [uncultured Tateyamaria sp.]
MMTWMKQLLGETANEETTTDMPVVPDVTRAELSDLFADDLARPALQKRAKVRLGKPRRLMAGRQLQFA